MMACHPTYDAAAQQRKNGGIADEGWNSERCERGLCPSYRRLCIAEYIYQVQ